MKALQQGKETVWSGGIAGQESGQTTLVYGRVVRVNNAPVAYLFVAFYPPQLADRLPPELPTDSNVTLIDDGGIVLLSSRDPSLKKPTVDVSGSKLYRDAANGQSVLVRDEKTPLTIRSNTAP